MELSLAEYYATNYTKCNLTFSFLASWKGVVYPTHTCQVISLSLQLLSFYVILTKTPKSMKSVKWPLFINHLCCVWFDFSICALSTLYIIYPVLGVISLGLLSSLGVPVIVQLCLVVGTAILAASSYIFLFESRSNYLMQNIFRIKKTRTRVLYHLIVFLINASGFIMVLKLPTDQTTAVLDSLNIYPCPTKEFFEFPVYIVTTDKYILRWITWFFLPLFVINGGVNAIFHIITTIYYLYVVPSSTISRETQQNQKAFLKAITFQVGVPFFLAATPAFIITLIYSTGYYTQESMNLVIDIVALHGIGEGVAIITVHKHYRQAVKRMFSQWVVKLIKRDTSVRDTRVGSNNYL